MNSFLKDTPGENEKTRESYNKWSEAYENLYAKLPTDMKWELEELWGHFNDLSYATESQAYTKGILHGFCLVFSEFPEFQDKIKELGDNITLNN